MYEWEEGMREISGFGGSYEEACQKMLKAGLEWWDANPEADPQFHGFKGIYGIVAEDNPDAETLSKVVIDASGGDCTGAMHQAVISSIFWIHKNGWGKYVVQMKTGKEKQDDNRLRDFGRTNFEWKIPSQ